MTPLFDNDIVLKLAAFDLLDVTRQLFGVSATDCFIRDATKYVFRKRRNRLAQVYSEAGMDRAIQFAETARTLFSPPPRAIEALLVDIDAIDPGEAALFAHLTELPSHVLLIGDKRSLNALATAPAAAEVLSTLSRRVMCLEALVEALIFQFDFDLVKSRVTPMTSCDKVMQVVFGSGPATSYQNAQSVLKAYLRDLEMGPTRGLILRYSDMEFGRGSSAPT